MIIVNLIIGIIIGLILSICLTPHRPVHLIIGGASGLLGSLIGNNILESPTLVTDIFTALIGAVCLSLLLLYLQKLFFDFAK
ncbi:MULTISPECIES: hypothetical protein [Staphylococcus]|uniref:hypothetical protein n=1 Tax=Staphylococcus TaxID=1279 RepID=UPI00115E4EE3|nr:MULTISPECIES: hypothetical protein [Staphylococcus]MDG0838922.1 hypothetical protein [Staphylococcus equorum]MDK9850560.1 hypothetical protein [Staphylococcus equorum]